MSHFKTLLLSFVVTLTLVTSASALVTVSVTSTSNGILSVGDTFEADIFVTWDGAGALTGILSSHTWDSSQLTLLSAVYPLASSFETAPLVFFDGMFANLTRFGTIAAGIAGDDLSSSARTIQYVGPVPVPATSAQTVLVTRLTFQVIGFGDGPIAVNGTLLASDIGAAGDSFVNGSLVFTPEPGTALLMGLGLAGLAGTKRGRVWAAD